MNPSEHTNFVYDRLRQHPRECDEASALQRHRSGQAPTKSETNTRTIVEKCVRMFLVPFRDRPFHSDMITASTVRK